MEVLVAFILILVLLFCTGAQMSIIIAVILGALSLVNLLILVFFVCCMILLAGAERKTAVFSKIDKNEHMRFDCAYYLVDGEEYRNAFPCEVALRKKLYIPEKQVTVRLVKKKNIVFDANAFTTTIAGTAFFAALMVISANGLFNYFT
ncbi:MAG: hypothetical protein J5999_08620 [Oscillospiraceae bacterium]|nr:hypothetical protein [Oscillospiraceae bacterium]